MKKLSYIFLFLILILFGTFWTWEIGHVISLHWHNFYIWCQNTHRTYYPWIIWISVGMCVFPVMNHRWKNSGLMKTFAHETAHMVVNFITFQDVESIFASSNKGGVVWSRHAPDSKVPHYLSSLAPYCFPYFTIGFLLLRCLCISSLLPIMDILIGMSVGFHAICFKEQTRSNQPDINSYPLWFSYTYIVHFWLFDIALILTSILPKSNCFLAFKTFGMNFWLLFFN